jgi:hypothetical protein
MTRTNEDFANAVTRAGAACDFTMASKMRNGHRSPSAVVLAAIWAAFELDGNDLLAAYREGPKRFGDYLVSNVFDAPDDTGEDGNAITENPVS